MKKMGTVVTTLGIVGLGVTAYCMMNKKNKKTLEECYNNLIEDVIE